MNLSAEMVLILSALVFGLRHGIDWDHIAAITDITGSQDTHRQSLWLGSVYALGHGTVVGLLGLLAVTLGAFLPRWIDGVMERVVGATLLILGVYVIYSILKDRKDFKLRSRWMLIFEGVERGYRWLMGKVTGIEMDQPVRQHNYGFISAYLVGVIHGIGAETPTQVLLFIAASGAGGQAVGVVLVLTFLVGLLISNSIITVMSTYGFLTARKNTPALLVLGSLVAVFSLTVGAVFLFGQSGMLPAILGG